jgi:hypothetical protein
MCLVEHGKACFDKTYQLIVKKLQNKIVSYKETAECQHQIFWPGCQGRLCCHTAKLGQNQRVSVDEAQFLVQKNSIA